MLIGRETETAGLGRLLEAARGGTSGALLLRGEAGIGKTALLEEAAAAAEGFVVLRATGIESEAELPYAALHQLLRPLEDRIEHLAGPQASALGCALGLLSERDTDRFLVGVGTLTLMADAAEEQPVLAILDDAAWFDQESGHALGFAARRLQAEGVVLLFAVRDEPGRQFALPGVAEMRIERLAEEPARTLLAARYGDGLDGSRRDDVLHRAAGNPLALLELARDGTTASGPEQAFGERVLELPASTQELLLIAAADATRSLAVIGQAARDLGLDAAALEPAETAGLVHVAHGTFEFRHPLVRSAVYNGAPFGARARVHLALAGALTADEDADRRAWHRASAVLGTDDKAAGDLECTADRAQARAGHAAASAALERSAELTADGGVRTRRLVAAARAAGMAGENERALALVNRVGTLADPGDVALVALIRAASAMHRTSPRECLDWCMRALEAGHEAAPAVALQAAIIATEACAQGRLWERLPDLRALVEVTRAETDDERAALATARGFCAFAADDFDVAFPALERALVLGAESDDPLTLLHAAWAAAYTGDLVQPAALAARAERAARATGALAALSVILTTRATWENAAGRYAAGESAAIESLALAKETGQDGLAAVNLAMLALADAVRGNEASCRERAAEAIAAGEAWDNCHPVSAATAALGILELGMGRPAEAVTRLRAVFEEGHMTYRHTVVDDLIEAAVRAGQPDDALDPLAAWQRWVRHSGLVVGEIVIARARAFLAPPEDADERFLEALAAHERVPWPFVHARTELAYGEFLRRARRKTDARVQLRSALARFEALDATPWADRAAAELRATGETARKRDPSTLPQLTPQELQIARLVAEGGRNREIAARLFLSPKTVEYHLRKVFQKLDIASRNDLIRLFGGGQAPSELVPAAP